MRSLTQLWLLPHTKRGPHRVRKASLVDSVSSLDDSLLVGASEEQAAAARQTKDKKTNFMVATPSNSRHPPRTWHAH